MENIAILTGGDSSEYDISILSANNVLKNIDKSRYNCVIVLLKDGIYKVDNITFNLDDFSYKKSNIKYTIDKVFMALHGTPAENGLIQDYFDKIKIPYTSCNSVISALTFNKFKCNQTLKKYGFKCANSILISVDKQLSENEIIRQIGIPQIVKPNSAGSSYGISLVRKKNQLKSAISNALKYDSKVIIENLIVGTEVSSGVYFDGENIKALPLTEIISDNEFFDFEAKYEGKSREITPAKINNTLTQLVKKTSINIYERMQLSGICRIDYIIEDKIPYIIEINTIPGLTEKSIIPQQIKADGLTLKEIFNLSLSNIN